MAKEFRSNRESKKPKKEKDVQGKRPPAYMEKLNSHVLGIVKEIIQPKR